MRKQWCLAGLDCTEAAGLELFSWKGSFSSFGYARIQKERGQGARACSPHLTCHFASLFEKENVKFQG